MAAELALFRLWGAHPGRSLDTKGEHPLSAQSALDAQASAIIEAADKADREARKSAREAAKLLPKPKRVKKPKAEPKRNPNPGVHEEGWAGYSGGSNGYGKMSTAPADVGRGTTHRGVGISLKKVADALIEAGMDLPTEIIRTLQTSEVIDEDTKLRVKMELLQYVQPKLKAIEVTGANGGPVEVSSLSREERMARIAALQSRLGIK